MNKKECLRVIFRPGYISANPNIIFTFPTSNGNKLDILNFGVMLPIFSENVVIVCLQTRDYDCFYNPHITDNEKVINLENYLHDVDKVIDDVLERYRTIKIPIVMGCSMGGYYAHLMYMRYPNKFNCITFGGLCDLSILDKNANNGLFNDRIIDYYNNKQIWDKYNPMAITNTDKLHTKIIACYGLPEDNDLINGVYEYYLRLNTWNYIKKYTYGHNFTDWGKMLEDVFKGKTIEFHEFRREFYD